MYNIVQSLAGGGLAGWLAWHGEKVFMVMFGYMNSNIHSVAGVLLTKGPLIHIDCCPWDHRWSSKIFL